MVPAQDVNSLYEQLRLLRTSRLERSSVKLVSHLIMHSETWESLHGLQLPGCNLSLLQHYTIGPPLNVNVIPSPLHNYDFADLQESV